MSLCWSSFAFFEFALSSSAEATSQHFNLANGNTKRLEAMAQTHSIVEGDVKTTRTAFVPNTGNVDIRNTSFLPASTCTVRTLPAYPARSKRLRCRPLASDKLDAKEEEAPSAGEENADISKSGSTNFGASPSSADDFFERLREITRAETALSNPLGLKKSYEIVTIDEEGIGPRDRYVYVEERDCIGCTHCSTTAVGTFFMDAEYGRARVFDQVGDSESQVEEAIDTCPVNCIYYVDWKDLVALENMRDDQVINNKARLVGGSDLSNTRKGKTKTTVMDSGIIRCEDCPGRGCSQCPMYGVGENPEYLRQKAMREAKKRNEGVKRRSKRKLL